MAVIVVVVVIAVAVAVCCLFAQCGPSSALRFDGTRGGVASRTGSYFQKVARVQRYARKCAYTIPKILGGKTYI